jgi:hypothetical protein
VSLQELYTGGPVCLKKETWFCHCEEAFFADEAIPLTWRGDCFGVKSTPRNDSEFLRNVFAQRAPAAQRPFGRALPTALYPARNLIV